MLRNIAQQSMHRGENHLIIALSISLSEVCLVYMDVDDKYYKTSVESVKLGKTSDLNKSLS